MNKITHFALAGLVAALIAPIVPAQQPTAFEAPNDAAPRSEENLRTLVGPIALYPDDLVGVILPASTYPLQIVQASRFLDRFESDNSLQPDEQWDDTVLALLNYPEILRLMDQNIEWTWALGEAVLDEQPAVLDAIQSFRREAMLAGNLASNEQLSVSDDGESIEIAPADPEVIYIPYYEPERVVVVQPRPVIHFYARPYPVYYYPYPYGYSFYGSYFWGVTTAFSIGWHSHVLHVYHHRHHSHPYYGRVYYSPWYPRYHVNVYANHYVWKPHHRPVARPHRTGTQVRTVASRERQLRPPANDYRSQSLPRERRTTNSRTTLNTRAQRRPSQLQPRVPEQPRAVRPSDNRVAQRPGSLTGGTGNPPGLGTSQSRQARGTAAAPRYTADRNRSAEQRRYTGAAASRPISPPANARSPQVQTQSRARASNAAGSRPPSALGRAPTLGSAPTAGSRTRSAPAAAPRAPAAQRSPARIGGVGAGAGRTRR